MTQSVASTPTSPPNSSSEPLLTKHQYSYPTMDANSLADYLGVAPVYMHQLNERWSSAALQYQEMLSNTNSNRDSPTSDDRPDNNNHGASDPKTIPGIFRESSWNDHLDVVRLECPRSWSGMLSPNISRSNTSWSASRLESRGDPSQNSLELEAIAAVHELSFAVDAISVSEMLPRTPELIFVNVTTVEGKSYCMELTFKGWRVTSMRHDCMNGDYNQIELHTRYFETPYALMDHISLGYRDRFSEKLSDRLRQLEAGMDRGCAAPPSSFCREGAFPDEWDEPPVHSREPTATPPDPDSDKEEGIVITAHPPSEEKKKSQTPEIFGVD